MPKRPEVMPPELIEQAVTAQSHKFIAAFKSGVRFGFNQIDLFRRHNASQYFAQDYVSRHIIDQGKPIAGFVAAQGEAVGHAPIWMGIGATTGAVIGALGGPGGALLGAGIGAAIGAGAGAGFSVLLSEFFAGMNLINKGLNSLNGSVSKAFVNSPGARRTKS